MSINKPVCSFNELKASYRLELNTLRNEKVKMEQDMHFTINVLTQKLKDVTGIKVIKGSKCNKDSPDYESTETISSASSIKKVDPTQQKLYINKIDELAAKVKSLETENKSLKESLNFYRTSSAVKSIPSTDTDKDHVSITESSKEDSKETREDMKERYEKQIKEIREQMENNSLILVLKGEKDKLESEVKELNRSYQSSLEKIKELQAENEELAKKNAEYNGNILNVNSERDKYKLEYIKTKTELKALIEYLKETKEVYEKEIEELNSKLSLKTHAMQMKKVSNEVNELLVEYLILKYGNAYSMTIFDILAQMINKINIFKWISIEKIEANSFAISLFNDIISFLKYNPQCDIEMFLNTFSLMNTNDAKAFNDKLLSNLGKNEEIDIELIEKKFTNIKKTMISNANTSLEIIKSSICLLNTKDQQSTVTSNNIFQIKPQNGDNRHSISNAIVIDKTKAHIKGDELSKLTKCDINYFFQIEISKVVDIALSGNIAKEHLFSLLLNCNNVSRLSLDSFDISKTLNQVVLFIESFTKLKSLSISNSNLNDDNIGRISHSLKSNQSIESISFTNSKITPDGLFQFADCLILNSGITHIDLSNNKIKDIETFCSVINNNHDYVTHITLVGNPLIDHDFEAIGMFLTENKKLRYLDISKTKISPKAAHNLRNAIGKNSTLEELVMNQIKFNEETITILSTHGNYGLTSIQISDTELNEGCLMLLGNAINTLKSLERLYIKNTKPKSIGLTSLLDLISTKESLKEVHIEGNEITEDVIITFSTGLWTNKILPKVFLSQRLIPKKFVEAIRNHKCTVIVDE